MPSLFVNVEFHRNSRFSQSPVEVNAVLRHYTRILAGMPEENRRSIFRYLFFTREHLEKLRIRVFTEEMPLRTSVSVRFS